MLAYKEHVVLEVLNLEFESVLDCKGGVVFLFPGCRAVLAFPYNDYNWG